MPNQSDLSIVLADITQPKAMTEFLAIFLTQTELDTLTKRLAIAELLSKGQSYQEIAQSLKVSSATIAGVAENLSEPGWQLALKKLAIDRWAERVVRQISLNRA